MRSGNAGECSLIVDKHTDGEISSRETEHAGDGRHAAEDVSGSAAAYDMIVIELLRRRSYG